MDKLNYYLVMTNSSPRETLVKATDPHEAVEVHILDSIGVERVYNWEAATKIKDKYLITGRHHWAIVRELGEDDG